MSASNDKPYTSTDIKTCDPDCPCKLTSASKVGEASYVDTSKLYSYPPSSGSATVGGTYTPTYTYPLTYPSPYTTIPVTTYTPPKDFDDEALTVLIDIATDVDEDTQDRIEAAALILNRPRY